MARKKVTIIGAGATGGAMAQRLIERDICDVVLQDDPQFAGTMHFGKALDESQAAAWEGFSTRITATDGWEDTADSDVVICTAGAPRKPMPARFVPRPSPHATARLSSLVRNPFSIGKSSSRPLRSSSTPMAERSCPGSSTLTRTSCSRAIAAAS